MPVTAEQAVDDVDADIAPEVRLRRRVWWAVVLATLLQLVPRLYGQLGGWFFADDFWRQDAVARASAWEVAVQGQGGHVAPITYWLMHAWASVTPFQWELQVVATGVLWLLTDVVVLLAFRALWGWGWPTAAAYACYALSTFTLPSFLWSSQVWLGSMAVLSLGLLVLGTVRAVRAPSGPRTLVALLLLVVSLLLSERAAFEAVLVGLLGIVAYADRAGGLRALLRRTLPLYLGAAGVLALYAAYYLTVTRAALDDPLLTVRPGTDGLAANLLEGLGQSVLPGVLGGPWFLDAGTGVVARTELPGQAVLVAAELVLVVVVGLLLVRRRGWRSLALLALVVLGTVALIAVARGSAGGQLAMRDWRYFANLSVWVPLLAVLALVPAGAPGDDPWPRLFPDDLTIRVRRHPVLAALVVLVLLHATATTTYQTLDRFAASTSRPFLQRTLADLERLGRPVVLADRQLPDAVVPAVLTTQTLASHVLSAATPRPQFDVATPVLYVVADDGSVVLADVVPSVQTPPGPDGSCGYAVRPGTSVLIPMQGSLFEWNWWLRVDYLAQSDTTLQLRVDRDTYAAPVTRGPGQVFVPVTGRVDRVLVSAPDDGGGVCVAGVRAGAATPATAR
jgi:hypothetical protein